MTTSGFALRLTADAVLIVVLVALCSKRRRQALGRFLTAPARALGFPRPWTAMLSLPWTAFSIALFWGRGVSNLQASSWLLCGFVILASARAPKRVETMWDKGHRARRVAGSLTIGSVGTQPQELIWWSNRTPGHLSPRANFWRVFGLSIAAWLLFVGMSGHPGLDTSHAAAPNWIALGVIVGIWGLVGGTGLYFLTRWGAAGYYLFNVSLLALIWGWGHHQRHRQPPPNLTPQAMPLGDASMSDRYALHFGADGSYFRH